MLTGPLVDGSDIGGVRLLLGQQLARLRREAGHTQESFARVIGGYTRATVADAERGRRNLSRDFWRRCDEALMAEGRLVSAFDEMLVTLAADDLGKAAGRAAAEGARGALGSRHTAVGHGNSYRTPAVTIQRCPNCGHPLTVITLISGYPGPGPRAARRPGTLCVKPDIQDELITRTLHVVQSLHREFASLERHRLATVIICCC